MLKGSSNGAVTHSRCQHGWPRIQCRFQYGPNTVRTRRSTERTRRSTVSIRISKDATRTSPENHVVNTEHTEEHGSSADVNTEKCGVYTDTQGSNTDVAGEPRRSDPGGQYDKLYSRVALPFIIMKTFKYKKYVLSPNYKHSPGRALCDRDKVDDLVCCLLWKDKAISAYFAT